MVNKRLINTGEAAPAPFDPLQNFETVTYTGNGSTQKITGYIRKGAAFNGSSSLINAPLMSLFGGKNTNTISLWFRSTGTTTTVLHSDYGGNSFNNNIFLNFPTTGNIRFISRYSSTDSIIDTTSGTFNDGQWHHIVSVVDIATLTKTVYIDEVIVGTPVSISANAYNGDANARSTIGSEFDTGTSTYQLYFNGSIDQVRIFDRALTAGEVGQLALETYANPKKSTTDYFGDGSGVALYELDDDANSSNFEQAAVFNGSSSRISLPTSTFNTLTSYTISSWIYLTSTADTQTIFTNYDIVSGSTRGVGIRYRQSASNIEVFNIINSSATGVFSVNSIPQNTWTNLTVTNTQSEIKIYINGSLDSSHSTGGFNSYSDSSTDIGALTSRLGEQEQYFNGKIDQVRIYNTALSSGDVTNLYNESSVPASGLVAHYKLDGNATDETGTYDGTETSITYSTGVYGGTPTNVNFLGMAFQPDMIWVKGRTVAYDHGLVDSVRGTTSLLYPDLTQAASTGVTNAIQSFDLNGFTWGSNNKGNASDSTYVAWCWKAGGSVTPNNNTDGSITSTVSANPDAGFSVVKWTAPSSGTNARIGHGLSAAPEIIFNKRTDGTSDWYAFTTAIDGSYDFLKLNTTNAKTDDSSTYLPNSTTISSQNFTSSTWISYCFHSVDGYQKVGSYTGDNSTDRLINTGFAVRFVVIKKTNGISNWQTFDSLRGGNAQLDLNSSDTEWTGGSTPIEFVSNGFKIKTNYTTYNATGGEYIYLAIA